MNRWVVEELDFRSCPRAILSNRGNCTLIFQPFANVYPTFYYYTCIYRVNFIQFSISRHFFFYFFLQLNPSCRNRIRLRVYRNGIEILSPIIQHYSQCFTHIRIVHEIIHSERNGFNDQGDKLPFVASWPIIFESGQYVRSLSTVYNY